MNTPEENPRMLGALLRIPFQAIVSRIDAGLRARGFDDLRPAHFVIFQHIGAEGSRITELADRAQITKQSMGALVEYVASHGYVEILPDPKDHRAKIVRLTKKGRSLENTAREILRQTESEWADEIGTDQMRALKQALQDIITLIERR